MVPPEPAEGHRKLNGNLETVTLAGGRKLAYAEFGLPDGEPVLYFHGSPSSRLEPSLVGDETWRRLGLRIVGVDRPGIGGSDFQPGRRFADWPADVTALADALGLQRFAVMGCSGGAPYVAVCAARIPERVRKAVVVSGGWRMDWPEARDGLPTVNRVVLSLARHARPVLALMLGSMRGIASGERDKELARMKARKPAPDYEAIAVPGRLEAFGATLRECLKQGGKGAAWDLGLYMRDFGFRLEDVRVPITLFHGDIDPDAPIAMARKAAALLPGSQLVTYPGEAHLSTFCNHVDEIGAALRG